MTYTVVVDKANARVELYATGESFWFSTGNGDIVIKNAEFRQREDAFYINGTQQDYALVLDELELTPEEFATSKYRKTLFEKTEVTERKWTWRFPFVRKVKREIYVLDTGWNALEKTKQVDIQISKKQMALFDYSKNVDTEDAEDK